MGASFRLRLASPDDLPSVLGLIENAAAWLRTKGTTQWQHPWPDREERDRRVHDSLSAGETWLLWDGSTPMATITLTPEPDDLLWTAQEREEPALYLHRLVVHRKHAGLGIGAHLLDWAGVRARRRHLARWIRIDVWADNHALHRYYRKQGFRLVRQSAGIPGYPAGALFQKDVRNARLSRRVPFETDPPSENGSGPHGGEDAAAPLRESAPAPAHRTRPCARTPRLPRP
ncbi:GNAT family N-acetyltransferase [Actinomadura sp. SCN-SB]|uniref:GNAT family N-acetyltransferase n=1 Tax=Actinomadura sp. SCN-SB TaxID=3373092 RepID=UPI0037537E09